MMITYQSFRAKEESSFVFHVWWLKEFKNRWFAVGVKGKGLQIMHLALDRIGNLVIAEDALYVDNEEITPSEYYRDVVGVTVSSTSRANNVKLFVSNEHAPYVTTKPMHHSQELVETKEDGIIINLKVQLNFELEREILGYAEGMRVLAPEYLRRRIFKKLKQGVYNYNDGNGAVNAS
jgi:predicted DNA-binding transcriptional regulator YafY